MSFPSLTRFYSTKVKLEDENAGQTGEPESTTVMRNYDQDPHLCKPIHYEGWIRTVDENENIYYYNVKSGESAWLRPCRICYRSSDKFCRECSVSYCERHFVKLHANDAGGEGFSAHHWQVKEEGSRDEIGPEDEYCISCLTKKATKMCTECWDGYCSRCFPLAHSSGHLKTHQATNFKLAKQGWYKTRRNGKGSDYYYNGTSKESTYEKPPDLMNTVERQYYDNFTEYKNQADSNVKKIEELQYELERLKFSKDSMVAQMTDLMNILKGKGPKEPK
jgi:hypothetical protein